MIELFDTEIVAFDPDDRATCQIAAEASSASKPLLPLRCNEPLLVVNEHWTARVLQGLANISLRATGFDYGGLSQAKADYILGELSGSVDDFIYEITREAQN